MSTAIAWTDRTWNPVVGCTKVSQGCKHCYAKTLHDQRHRAFKAGKLQNHTQYAAPFETVQMMGNRVDQPVTWRKPARVFVNSMSDLFHDDVTDEFLDHVFARMALAQQHTFQVLTKRPERMLTYLSDPQTRENIDQILSLIGDYDNTDPYNRDRFNCGNHYVVVQDAEWWPLPNVCLGVSVEDQKAADERIPLLIDTPATIRFLSCEPLLGFVHLAPHYLLPKTNANGRDVSVPSVDWIIVGGESGKGCREMDPAWARHLRDQCKAVRIPFFLKQLGGYPDQRSHTKAVLDGRTHTEFPR